MTTYNASLVDTIDQMDNTAKIASLRAVIHSCLAKCIGAIRQDIRDRNQMIRDENARLTDLDQRNAQDEEARLSGLNDDIHETFGTKFNDADAIQTQDEIPMEYRLRTPKMDPLKLASLLKTAHDWALNELNTVSQSLWDTPLSFDEMLSYMIERSPQLNPTLAKTLAEAAKTDVKTIHKMHELQAMREQEQLLEAAPEIRLTFNGLDGSEDFESIDNLPVLLQHQLGIKIVESLHKAKDQVIIRVMRNKRLADLSNIPVLEDAANNVSAWVTQFEKEHKDELLEAINAGRTVRSLEDVTPA